MGQPNTALTTRRAPRMFAAGPAGLRSVRVASDGQEGHPSSMQRSHIPVADRDQRAVHDPRLV